MSILGIAVPVALLFVAAAIAAFVWAVRTGQMDDLETPAMRVLHDDEVGSERGVSRRPSGRRSADRG